MGQAQREAEASSSAYQRKSVVRERQIFLSWFVADRRTLHPADQALSAGGFSSRNR